MIPMLLEATTKTFNVDGALELATKGTTYVLDLMFQYPILCAGLIVSIVVSCAGMVIGIASRRGKR